MSWRKITCRQREEIFTLEREEALRPLSSCTDLSGEYHGEPQMDITWGLTSTDTPVLKESRYPSRDGGPDRKPCEHWEFYMTDEDLAEKMSELIYNRTQLVEGDADDLAWDLLNMVKSRPL
ncbi:hypothetical protein FHT44_005030 [Mycolicibacterium sp. BK634]|nr:hypothetical protein [Mycolicibacterium sp. BK634]